jgi:hypothetical protein
MQTVLILINKFESRNAPWGSPSVSVPEDPLHSRESLIWASNEDLVT